MIQSLFILSPTGEVLIERHFRGVVTPRSVCDHFWDRASVSINHHGGLSTATSLLLNERIYDTVEPVMEVPGDGQGTLYLISALRDGLSYLAICPAEVSPLLILEFLHRIASIFVEYFGSPADESTIKDNFSTVYQLLEEMVDYGWPLTTEPNSLKAMIRPPTVMSKLLNTSTTVSDELPSGTISNMPWRAAGVHYTQNEIYMDIIEEIDAIIDARGGIVSSEVSGVIQCQTHLSGIPDLLLTFTDPAVIDDCSFHPCVRYNRFERDQVVSFVPPDGEFELMRYRISKELANNFTPPLYCHAQWNVESDSTGTFKEGRIVLQVGLTHASSLNFSASRKGPFSVEDVSITIPFPKTVSKLDCQVGAYGSVVYDEAGKVARWNLGKLDMTKKPQLNGTFVIEERKRTETAEKDQTSVPTLSVQWKIPLSSVSGISVSGLSVTGESYRPYKGVKNITQSGNFQVRCV